MSCPKGFELVTDQQPKITSHSALASLYDYHQKIVVPKPQFYNKPSN
jgi:hypothetical protein